MILSDEEIHEAIKTVKNVKRDYAGWVKDQRIAWGRALESAILEKLGNAPMPDPVGTFEETTVLADGNGEPHERVDEYDAYSDTQLQQAYLQGAAAQLSGVWRPIETAPRDGNTFLLWWPAEGRIITGESCGHYEWEDNARGSCDIKPTHWMPLPAPPTPKP